jgi:hypothetical protein
MAFLNTISVFVDVVQVIVSKYAMAHPILVLFELKQGELKTIHWIAYSLRPTLVLTLIEYIWSVESK